MQPVPEVSREDVERIVRRDYPADQFSKIMAILDEYGVESWQPARDRVQLALLKLAAGSLERLRRDLEYAKTDYRDALAPAEYPSYMDESLRVSQFLRASDSKLLMKIGSSTKRGFMPNESINSMSRTRASARVGYL